jgi:hypothetical protein
MLERALLYGHETQGAQEATHQWYEACVAKGTQNRRPAEVRREQTQHAATVCWSVTEWRTGERDSCGRPRDGGFGGVRIAQRANIWDGYSDILRTNQRLCTSSGSPSST